jgi:hypothetical protein
LSFYVSCLQHVFSNTSVSVNLSCFETLVFEYFDDMSTDRLSFNPLTCLTNELMRTNLRRFVCLGNSTIATSSWQYSTKEIGYLTSSFVLPYC